MTTITNTFDKLKEIEEVLSLFHDDMTLMFGGFGGIGSPPSLIQAILEKGVTNLNLIGNDTGFPDVGIGRLVTNERVKSLITSHIGSNPNAGRQLNEGRLQIEFSPQGTLAERIRAGGVGLGGILVDVGVDTIVEEGKRTVEMNGKTYLVETALTAEVAIVYAKKADPFGNLVFDKSARNMNPHVAMAGDITIVEAEEIVPLGSLDPEEIVVPGAFVNYIVPSEGVNWKWVWA
ncbi:acyl CoA:acetate/3-ketoacid CoA transferase subunit alpha [Bacillus cereus]|uniref:Acyl CoA:acetate/3-ketoacid CoA transferase subunit alpha n=1 Tax=Bacillus cereus TaxID=1396 RepID=A0A9X6VKJ1_BACCE|nr:acetate CoA-transferase subunit alpha [Bacillus cereus]PFB31724.1 acyl CoA:acetate/3-ketoacid CoA transferase subunit alpha [Bacillus cereus]PFC11415.1 acyl CoA:acetate/3-ketoacid CoA transferase subunit alpha [Bacillus cereus]PFD21957.1 acyl CoA:acetate/3-ketoacid CoA transferase subunit alpha [Bacillus cereus]PFL66796.1 acyl CoA:acetate/3-ketoacid CoA transferase subunit alpha [Bacillus cereus]PGW63150.1 acyl CoA:acetate/3-ketoacid CoA transferase subunit alpha [Bacillus cereus]